MISSVEKRVCAGGGHVTMTVTVDGVAEDVPLTLSEEAPSPREVALAVATILRHHAAKVPPQARREAVRDVEVSILKPPGVSGGAR